MNKRINPMHDVIQALVTGKPVPAINDPDPMRRIIESIPVRTPQRVIDRYMTTSTNGKVRA